MFAGSRARRSFPLLQLITRRAITPRQPDDRQINGTALINLLGSRGAAAVGALFLTLIGGSTEAFGQQSAIAQVTPAVLGVPAIAAPQSLSVTPGASQSAPAAVSVPAVRSAAADIAREAA